MGADDGLPFPGSDFFQGFPSLFGPHAPKQQAAGNAQGLQDSSGAFQVLTSQDFRRGHQRALKACFCAKMHGAKGQGGFPAAHVPLYHAAHGMGRCQIRGNFG